MGRKGGWESWHSAAGGNRLAGSSGTISKSSTDGKKALAQLRRNFEVEAGADHPKSQSRQKKDDRVDPPPSPPRVRGQDGPRTATYFSREALHRVSGGESINSAWRI